MSRKDAVLQQLEKENRGEPTNRDEHRAGKVRAGPATSDRTGPHLGGLQHMKKVCRHCMQW